MDYDNVLGFGIPDLLLNLLYCHGFSTNNESIVILKCPNRMSEYYFNKWFVIFWMWWRKFKILPSLVKDRVGEEVSVKTRLSHAMLYNHAFHFKYTEELVS